MDTKENLSRMSLQLSEAERDFILDLKFRLQKNRQTLRHFVLAAIREKVDREKLHKR